MGREIKRVALDFKWPLNKVWKGFLNYERENEEPPTGEGWQVWETVSEGSPISPVFVDSSACIRWLVGEGYSPEAAKKFVLEDQWTPSVVMVDGKMYKDIETVMIYNK